MIVAFVSGILALGFFYVFCKLLMLLARLTKLVREQEAVRSNVEEMILMLDDLQLMQSPEYQKMLGQQLETIRGTIVEAMESKPKLEIFKGGR